MIGTLDQERMRSTTSEPSMSGSPRSTITRSIGRSVAERIASVPVPASCTTKPLSSKPVRRKRRIWVSSSTTSTTGDGSLICVAFHLWNGGLRYREFDRNRRAQTGARTDGGHLTTNGRDKGIGDPQPQAGTAGGSGMAVAAHETVPYFRLFGGGQSAALVAHAEDHAVILRARRHRDAGAGIGVFHRIVEDLHQGLLHQHRIDMDERQIVREIEHDMPVGQPIAAALERRIDDVFRIGPFGMRLDAVAADAGGVE